MAKAPTVDARIQPALHAVFLRYVEWSLKRHFNAIRITRTGHAPVVSNERPLVVFLNHASWWDPLLMLWLGRALYPKRAQFGPMDAEQLQRYAIFKRLGVFGVEKGTAAGARTFLRSAEALLAKPGAMLWLTPQGRFADSRERPVRFASGLAHLSIRVPQAAYIPLAIEYTFGVERFPEINIHFAPPLEASQLGQDSTSAQQALEQALQSAQDTLLEAVCRKDPSMFAPLLQGRGGASLPYDLWRTFVARWQGTKPQLNHSLIS